jgi:citrate synthase
VSCEARRHPVTVSETKVRNGKDRVHVHAGTAAVPAMGFASQMLAPVLVAARLPGLTPHLPGLTARLPGLTARLAGQPRGNGITEPRASYDDQRTGHLAGEG